MQLQANYSAHNINSVEWKRNAIIVVSYVVVMFQFWDETYSTINKREFIIINTASEKKRSVRRWLKTSPQAVIRVLCLHKG